MSQTFTVTGTSSLLTVDFSPPIMLNTAKSYSLALIGMYTYNTIPNIEDGVNNKFYYYKNDLKAAIPNHQVITIPTGAYEIMDIEKYLQSEILRREGGKSSDDPNKYISLKANNNTLKCELKSELYFINFVGASNSLGEVLGFSHGRLLDPCHVHYSDLPVNIIRVSTVRLECNIVTGSYYNAKPSHTLYEFSPAVDPGYSINIEPRTPIFLPITNEHLISNITLKLIDQHSRLVNFRGEEIIVRLELRER